MQTHVDSTSEHRLSGPFSDWTNFRTRTANYGIKPLKGDTEQSQNNFKIDKVRLVKEINIPQKTQAKGQVVTSDNGLIKLEPKTDLS